MQRTITHVLRRSLAAAFAAALLVLFMAGCADEQPTLPTSLVRSGLAARVADLAGCDTLRAPAGSKLAFHAYASGVQIYRWSGASWVFVAPSATLFADAGGKGVVGTHYAGPTWASVSGSKVVGAVARRCVPDANAIPWLLLSATPDDGPGIFHRVSSIQRLNTVGGMAPAGPGGFVGEVAEVPYTAEYFFYR